MPDPRLETHAVTGAFSYTGKYIAKCLAREGVSVRALVRSFPGDTSHGYDCRPLQFSDRGRLVSDLEGVGVLYNTYWIRFERRTATFAHVVENIAVLASAAKEAGVGRIVHLSVSNPSIDSPFGYFRGKAAAERAIAESGVPSSIIRPTLVFGAEDILVNNIAWLIRHLHLFVVPGNGRYRVQPVLVSDVARLAADEGMASGNRTLDAAGPETFEFARFVELLRDGTGAQAGIVRAPLPLALALGKALSIPLRDELITREELEALMTGLLVSRAEPIATTAFTSWLDVHGTSLGSPYTSEIRRHWASGQ
jgi:NADH dehydrogenase